VLVRFVGLSEGGRTAEERDQEKKTHGPIL
jgi:hypothetical protein